MKNLDLVRAGLSRRAFVASSAAAAATLVLAGCNSGSGSSDGASSGSGASSSGEKTALTFCLDYTPNTNHTGIYVAKNQGYFDEEGLDVTIVQPADGTAEGAIGTGQAQFGVSYQDYIAAAYDSGNTGLTAIAAVIQHNTSGIMSRAEDNITRAKEMENHVYTTWDMAVEQATIKQIMESDGGDYSKLSMVAYSVDDEVSGLKANLFDCVWVYEGWAVQNAKVQDYAVNYFDFRAMDDVFDFYTPVLAANTEYAAANPEVTKAFLRAAKKGYEFAVSQPAEAAKILCQEVPELDSALVEASAKFLAGEYISEAESWGVIDPTRWSNYFQWLNNNSLVQNKLDVNGGYDTSYLA
ncbi:ABC transporter substrate-binding protein [Paratractidigestivibacter sp.]|uniref:ABC transporter substrate-binding protein n=1 Tax=Paratractidigestivibacter sp. TaxID=2847316 RepID=UPI002AC927D6|nr:ABC transporter substrate-binding protein [Paratractidigestivibacter sp.]